MSARTIGLLAFRSILFIIAGLLFTALTGQSLEGASRWWSLICIVCNIITILVLMAVCKNEGTTYRALIGNHKSQVDFKYTLFIVLIMLSLGMGGMYGFAFMIFGYVPVIMLQPIPIWLAVMNLFLLPFTIVFAEFPLYFGYGFNRIEKETGSKGLSVFIPMFFYSLQHAFIPLLFDWKHVLFRFLSFLPLLMVLGMIYDRKRKLKPLMIGHAVLDFATATQILLTSTFPGIYEMMNSIASSGHQ